MTFESSLAITNSTTTEIVLHLEPWGDQFRMPPATTLSLTAKAEESGSFEIEHLENEVIVWAWPSASVKVFSAGVEVGAVVGERPTVPAVPEGQRVSSFLRSILDQDRTRKS
jgi:hypothetical protein